MTTEQHSSGLNRRRAFLDRLGPTWLCRRDRGGTGDDGQSARCGCELRVRAAMGRRSIGRLLGTVGQYLAMRLGLLTEAGVVAVVERHLGSSWAWVLVVDVVLAAGSPSSLS